MTLEQLRVFVAVAKHLHITRAAGELNMTQSAASASIAALEARCKVKLFDRVGRHIELTEPGRTFLQEAKAVLARADGAELVLRELSGLQRGTLALSASQTIASYWLPPVLHKYRQRYPGILVAVAIGNTEQVAHSIVEGAADLGVVEAEADDPVLVRISVPGDRLVLVVAPQHPWADRASLSPGELTQSVWVLRERGSGTRRIFEDALHSYGIDPDALTVSLELPSNEAVRSAVEAGAGATVISRLVVENSLRLGTLHLVSIDFPERHFFVLRHADRYLTKAKNAFLDLVRRPSGPEIPSEH
ncbi:MAG TPA: LysR substrate-binding domain-containing protein [Xanthobacteraceae bacterium]|jgi:DNA-binding transcriptional LysR family regulator